MVNGGRHIAETEPERRSREAGVTPGVYLREEALEHVAPWRLRRSPIPVGALDGDKISSIAPSLGRIIRPIHM